MKELKICELTELEEAIPRRVELEEEKLALVLVDGKVYAIEDNCSHEDQYRYAWPSGDWGSLPVEGGLTKRHFVQHAHWLIDCRHSVRYVRVKKSSVFCSN